MRLALNTIIRWENGGDEPRFERTLYVNEANSEVWAIDVHFKRAVPVFYRYEELRNSILCNQAQILINYEPCPVITLSDEELGQEFAEYIKRRDKAWDLIRPLLEIQAHKLFNRKERRRLIVELAGRAHRSENTIYLYLRRYWQRGCVKNALFPDWLHCGSVRERKSSKAKLGRPSNQMVQTGQPTGRNVTPQDEENFREGIKRFFTNGSANSLPSTWQMIKEHYYTTGEYVLESGVNGDIIVPVLLPPDERPSYGQFKSFYYKERNPGKEIIAREGRIEYDQNVRPVLGSSTDMAFGPGAVYQIDATVGDIYLVNDFNREYLIGRPVIYIVIDTFSRLIAGFAVTLEGPNWVGAKLALENAFSNKVEFCKGLGIDITEFQWPVEGICESLLGDNGEIKSYNANSLVNPIGIRVSNAAVCRPDWKAIVEKNFHTTKGLYIDYTPGMIRPRRNVKGQRYAFEARLGLVGFRRLMVSCVLHYNNNHSFTDYPLDLHMIKAGVRPIPAHIWKYGMEHLTGRLREINDNNLRMNLLPGGKASVTGQGIYFGGLYYTCEMAIREQWFERIRGKRRRHLEVVSESTVDNIHIRFDNGKLYETCHLTPAYKRFAGKDWYEVREYLAWQRQQAKDDEADSQQALAEFHARIKSLIFKEAEETERALDAAKLSKRARLRHVRDNRNQLKSHERKHGLLSLDNPPSAWASPTTINKLESNTEMVRPSSPEGYVPPAKPLEEIRAAHERARKKHE